MPMAALLQFTPLYHAFHDLHDVHTEVCVCVIVALYIILAWSGDRGTGMEARNGTHGVGEGTCSRIAGYFSVVEIFVFFIIIIKHHPKLRHNTCRFYVTILSCTNILRY